MFTFLKKILNGNSDLKQIIKEGAYLVDVRTPNEFSYGSVKGAINIPVGDLQNKISKLKGKKNIVVFCKSGARSGMAKSILTKNGIQNVTNGGTLNNVNKIINE